MANILNAVFGIGTAVVVALVVLLGVNAFYPPPDYTKEYHCESKQYSAIQCNLDWSPAQCAAHDRAEAAKAAEYGLCQEQYQKDTKEYSRNMFFILNTIGIIAVIVSLFIMSMMNISVGVALAGLVLIVYGFAAGWRSTNDVLRFFVGLIIAVLVIFSAILVNTRLK